VGATSTPAASPAGCSTPSNCVQCFQSTSPWSYVVSICSTPYGSFYARSGSMAHASRNVTAFGVCRIYAVAAPDSPATPYRDSRIPRRHSPSCVPGDTQCRSRGSLCRRTALYALLIPELELSIFANALCPSHRWTRSGTILGKDRRSYHYTQPAPRTAGRLAR
jgi:hypothetical protein